MVWLGRSLEPVGGFGRGRAAATLAPKIEPACGDTLACGVWCVWVPLSLRTQPCLTRRAARFQSNRPPECPNINCESGLNYDAYVANLTFDNPACMVIDCGEARISRNLFEYALPP